MRLCGGESIFPYLKKWFIPLSVALGLSGCVGHGLQPTVSPVFQEGMAAFSREEYKKAELLFNGIIEDQPGSPVLSDAQWMLARSLEGQSELRRALIQYRLFIRNYPSHKFRDQAEQRISRIETQLLPQVRKREVRHAVVWPFSNQSSIPDLDRSLSRLKAAGVDAVVVRVYRNGTRERAAGVFFKTSRAPMIADYLTPLIEAAHRHQIMVFAWMSVREMDWILESNPGWADFSYDPKTLVLGPGGSLDLFQASVRTYIRALYQDLSKHSIDGIVFGDDLFYKMGEGLAREAQEQFRMTFGEYLPISLLSDDSLMRSSDLFWRWAGWKSRQSYNFLHDLREEIRTANPSLLFGMLLSDEAVLDPLEALVKNSQDLLEGRRLRMDYYIISADFSFREANPDTRMRDLQSYLSRVTAGIYEAWGGPENVLLKLEVSPDVLQGSQKPGWGGGNFNPDLDQAGLLSHAVIRALWREGSEPLGLLFKPVHAD